ENVKKVQAGYKVQTLSAFLGTPAPSAAPVVFIKPLTPEQQRTALEFFNILNFALRFCPTHPSETALMARFARLGIVQGKTFDPATLPPDIRTAVEAGMADAWRSFTEFKDKDIDTNKVVSGDVVGTRAHLKNNYLYRMSAAVLGIYGNSREE